MKMNHYFKLLQTCAFLMGTLGRIMHDAQAFPKTQAFDRVLSMPASIPSIALRKREHRKGMQKTLDKKL